MSAAMRIRFIVAIFFALVVAPAIVYFHHGGGAGSATATFGLDATLPCLQQAGVPASSIVSSTGNRQIQITDRAGGPSTYVTFLGSDSEAAWWVANMQNGVVAAHGLPDEVMFQRRNTMVELGAPSPTELASVDGCLR